MRLNEILQTEGDWVKLSAPPWWEWRPAPPRKQPKPSREVDRWGRSLISYTGYPIVPKKRRRK